MSASTPAFEGFEGRLAGIRSRIATVFEADDVHQADATMGVTTDDLWRAVEKAIAAAS